MHISVPSMHRQRDIIRSVAVRTADDTAIVQDLPEGARQVTTAFPVIPAFDALSAFEVRYALHSHMAVSVNLTRGPLLYYTGPAADAQADAVVMSLRYYRAGFAPDSSDAPDGTTHLSLAPYDFFVKGQPRSRSSTFFLSDLWVDNRTQLPSAIRYEGADGLVFHAYYGVIGPYWVITRLHYEATEFGPLRIGRVHFSADAQYDQFGFPASAPDARLAGVAAATPIPLPASLSQARPR
jgi:hypothetical protein